MCQTWLDDCCKDFRFDWQHRLLGQSWLHNWAIKFFFALYCITLRKILEAYLKECKGVSWWYENRYKFVESYVALWLSVELVFLFQLNNVAEILVIILLSWRLLDIFQAWFGIGILNPEPQPLSVPRMLILSLIGFVEVTIIFGIFAFLHKSSFQPQFCSIGQSLYYSVTTITALGSNYAPVDKVGYSLFYIEIAFGVLFLIVLIQRVLSLFHRPLDW